MTTRPLMLLGTILSICAVNGALGQSITTRRIVQGIDRPIYVTAPSGDSDRLFIVEQHTGQIKIFNLATETLNPEPFLDIDNLATGNEQGLLGLAFHPDYATNRKFYVHFTENGGTAGMSRIAEYVATSDDLANIDSRRNVLSFDQPFSNHNGGWIGFGPNDDYLYIASGDGGAGGDPGNRAQNLNSKLGKILRIDVDGTSHGEYGVPDANPFYDPGDTNLADDEVWAYGLRNPWRASFDRATGDFYIGDVGQGEWEEIDYQPAASTGGENYGWKVMEGNHCFANATQGNPPCFDPQFTPAIHDYPHGGPPDGGFSVTGGYAYRGPIPEIQGTYFFGDFGTSQIWSFVVDDNTKTNFQNRTAELRPPVGSIGNIASFGEDALGNLYIVDLGGEIFRVEARLRCDLTGDGLADAADFGIMATGWGTSGPGDCNQDGVVDAGDAGLLFGEWSAPMAAPVAIPEPSALWVALLLSVPVACRRPRTR